MIGQIEQQLKKLLRLSDKKTIGNKPVDCADGPKAEALDNSPTPAAATPAATTPFLRNERLLDCSVDVALDSFIFHISFLLKIELMDRFAL